MTAMERVIRWSTAGVVVGVAVVAAVASYEHAYSLVRVHGEAGWTGRLVPLTVDGLIYASSMVMLDSARRKTAIPVLARWLLGLGITATLATNVAHGLGHGPVGSAVAAWPAVALVGSYELLMMVIRGSQGVSDDTPGGGRTSDPLLEQAAEVFAEQLAADRVPSIRAIRSGLHVGQPRHNGRVTTSPQEKGGREKISVRSTAAAIARRVPCQFDSRAPEPAPVGVAVRGAPMKSLYCLLQRRIPGVPANGGHAQRG
jgi:hypothetical protein